jgi:hypothetical protein
MKFSTQSNNVDDVLLVDGITRAGKFLLAKVVSEFENVEYFQSLPILEHIPYIYSNAGITGDSAISLIQSSIDYAVYNQFLGRGLNHRALDRSSIYHSSDSIMYLKRQFENLENDDILQLMKRSNKSFLFATHNILTNINIFLEAYPNLKMIHIVRSPVDLVYSWNKKNYGKVNDADFLTMAPNIEKNNFVLPWYCSDWDDKYKKIRGVDFIIKSIKSLIDLTTKTISSLNEEDKKKILIVKYEDLIKNPISEIEKISVFLEKPVNYQVTNILRNEGLPNPNILNKRKEKVDLIYKLSSEEHRLDLEKMEFNYLNADNYYCISNS